VLQIEIVKYLGLPSLSLGSIMLQKSSVLEEEGHCGHINIYIYEDCHMKNVELLIQWIQQMRLENVLFNGLM